jgi:protein involved in polysaccharide export with SLBB domain
VGVQVGIIGSVNKPTVLELKAGETVADVLRVAGGFSAVADRSRLAVERLESRRAARVAEIALPAGLAQTLGNGDLLRAFSAVDIALPTERQSKRVRIEGEVQLPAEYVVPEGTSLRDLLRLAGGFTPAAFVFATEFNRQSVRITQQANYDRALRELESELGRAATSQRVASAEEASAAAARSATSAQLVERLRSVQPTGRIVLNLEPASRELPDLSLEDADRIYVPARPTTVGVFGSVFNAASYLFQPGKAIDDYLQLAGGPTKGADAGSAFLVRANGSVVSSRQTTSGWFGSRNALGALRAEPGDTVFFPEEANKTTFMQDLKDWSQVLSQFGLGAAAIKVLSR